MDQSQIWSVWHICNPQGHSNVKLQLAATFCITNLIWNEDDGKTAHTARILLGSLIMNVFKLCWQNVEVLKMFRRNNIHSHREGPRFTLKVHCTPRFKFIAVEFDTNTMQGHKSTSFLLCVLSGSQERQDKLKELGFVDMLHKLSQACDANLSDRCEPQLNSLHHNKTNQTSYAPECPHRAKTAMQQYLAWPQGGVTSITRGGRLLFLFGLKAEAFWVAQRHLSFFSPLRKTRFTMMVWRLFFVKLVAFWRDIVLVMDWMTRFSSCYFCICNSRGHVPSFISSRQRTSLEGKETETELFWNVDVFILVYTYLVNIYKYEHKNIYFWNVIFLPDFTLCVVFSHV